MTTNTTMNMCGTLGPYGNAVTSVAVLAAGQPPRQERVVEVAEQQRDAERGQDGAEHIACRDLHDADHQRRSASGR